VETLPRLSVPAVIVEWQAPGEETSRRYIVPAEVFNRLATGSKMADVLAAGQPIKAARRPGGGSGAGNIDYSRPENAGMPHRGKITEAEQEYVRAHLDEVNQHRQAAGHPPLDPNDPKTKERYGFS
jgi:hypothetical protein